MRIIASSRAVMRVRSIGGALIAEPQRVMRMMRAIMDGRGAGGKLARSSAILRYA
jgi:hypothetical protein